MPSDALPKKPHFGIVFYFPAVAGGGFLPQHLYFYRAAVRPDGPFPVRNQFLPPLTALIRLFSVC
jgi:hypothetical protein